MEELVKTFHIEANLLAAQIVNFVIVLLVLYKFAYGPILKTLNDRTKKIEKGLKDAEESQKKLQEITQKEKEVMTDAKKEAQTIIKKSEEEAKKAKDIAAGMVLLASGLSIVVGILVFGPYLLKFLAIQPSQPF